MASKPALVAGALALVAAAPLVWLGYGRSPRATAIDLDAPAAALATVVRTAHAQASGRAQALADLKATADVVATDAATVRDMTTAERGFRPRPDEHIEIGQVPVAGGAATSILRLPDEAPALPDLGRLGARAMIEGDALRVADIVTVTPSDPQRAAEVRGLLAVSQPVDLQPVMAALAGRGATVAIGERTVAIGGGAGAGEAAVTTIAGAPEVELRQARPAAAAAPSSVGRIGGPLAALLGLGLLGFGALGRRRRDPASVASVATTPITTTAPPVTTPAPDAAPARPAPSPSALDAPQATPTDASGGVSFGRYQTLSLLGSGGMADVYLARATGEAGFARRIALKVLQPHMARRPEAVNYFLNEARLAARLTHPCIVQVHDLGRTGDDYFIAMEYIDGADLDRLLRSARAGGRQVPVAIALAILRRVCDGLHAAHVARGDDGTPLGIIHRDVKSANVLVSSEGSVKVADFGIARAAVGVRTTTVGQTRGTVEVMAPEQRTGGELDARADVYGVGAIAYELLTGAPVNLDLAILLQYGIPGWPHLPALTRERPELPPELDAIVFGALAFDPAARPASCAALEELLAAVATTHRLVAGDKELAAWFASERAFLTANPALAVPTVSS